MDLFSLAFCFWAGLPDSFIVPLSGSGLFRGTPILAGGMGVARVVVGVVFAAVFCSLSNFDSATLACHATGLDAVQRWEEKKRHLVVP